MRYSPFICSAMLHLVLGAAIWHHSGTKPVSSPPVFYVELAGEVAQKSMAPAPQAGLSPTPAANEPDQPDPASHQAAQPEPALAVPEVEKALTGGEAAAQGEPAKVAVQQRAQVAPEISRAFAGAWHAQQMMYNTRRYLQVAGMAMREVLEGKLASARRERLNGAQVQIVASYDDGAAPAFSVKTESEELRALLKDETVWARVPSPKECKVQYRQVAFLVSLERGTIQVGLSPK